MECQLRPVLLGKVSAVSAASFGTKAETTRRPRRESFEAIRPEGFGLRRADVHAKQLAPAVRVDADDNDNRHRDDPPVLAHLQVGGVDPDAPWRKKRTIAADSLGRADQCRGRSSVHPRRAARPQCSTSFLRALAAQVRAYETVGAAPSEASASCSSFRKRCCRK